MGIFSSTPEEREAKEKQRRLAQQRAAQEAFMASPAGQARRARNAGRKVFQIDLPISHTVGATVPLVTAYATTGKSTSAAGLIEAIEAEGWHLENVGYVYRVTGSITRDKVFSSGQQEATHGEIVGIYLFRATEGPAPSALPECQQAEQTLLERVDIP